MIKGLAVVFRGEQWKETATIVQKIENARVGGRATG